MWGVAGFLYFTMSCPGTDSLESSHSSAAKLKDKKENEKASKQSPKIEDFLEKENIMPNMIVDTNHKEQHYQVIWMNRCCLWSEINSSSCPVD